MDPAIDLSGSAAVSRYLARDPELSSSLEVWGQSPLDEWLSQALSRLPLCSSPEDLRLLLSTIRQRFFVLSVYRDLRGLASLDEVMRGWTLLADRSVLLMSETVCARLATRYGLSISSLTGSQAHLIPVAMGKMGGFELNVSSDIDLIFLYDEEGQTQGPQVISNQEFFSRAAQEIARILNDPSPPGFVFRVDIRLRPDGLSGPAALPLSALEDYFVDRGLPWERHAWLRARSIDPTFEAALNSVIRPFVYRRYLDFGSLSALRDLNRRMLNDDTRKDRHDDIKLGAGGIRELEFSIQLLQLVRGGSDPCLQTRSTREALSALLKRGLISEGQATFLGEAYAFLRRLEHRIQYLKDAQTHRLPASEDDRAVLAGWIGFSGYEDLIAYLAPLRERVALHYAEVIGVPGESSVESKSEYDGLMEACIHEVHLGEEGARIDSLPPAWQDLYPFLRDFFAGRAWRHRSDASRRRLKALLGQAFKLAADGSEPVLALRGVLSLFEAIGGRETYLSLLSEYPGVLKRVVELARQSPWGMGFLVRHPVLLDELIELDDIQGAVGVDALVDEINRYVVPYRDDPERSMDALRVLKQRFLFRLALLDIEGRIPLMALSDRLTEVAEATVVEAWTAVSGSATMPGFCIVAFGKLGGKEMSYDSDLDVIFVFDEQRIASDKAARLAQRWLTWMSAVTAAGVLYAIDVRLRPDGASGLLVTTLPALRQYQEKRAMTWEHQALTRARPVAGDPQLCKAVETLREEILRLPRDRAKLREDVLAMRRRMRAEHVPRVGGWDIKRSRGGLIDVEFVVQYLVLAYAIDYPELTQNLGTIALLKRSVDLGLVSPLGQSVALHYQNLRDWIHERQLLGESEHVPIAEARGEALVDALWLEVFGETVG